MFYVTTCTIIIEKRYPQYNKIEKETKDEKQGIKFRSYEARCISTTWEVFFLILLYLVPLPLLIFPSQNTDLARDHPAVTVAAITKWLQSNHSYAFGIYGTVEKLFDRVSCINSFTETGERP